MSCSASKGHRCAINCLCTAGNLGFDTWVVSDATFTFAKCDYAGTERTADEVHAMSLANLAGEYAQIVDTEGALARFTTRRGE